MNTGKGTQSKLVSSVSEEGLAELHATLPIADLAGWLPEKWLVSIRGCKVTC